MTNLSLGEGCLYHSLETAALADYASDPRERFSLFASCGAHMLGLYGRRGDLVALNYCSSDNEIKITTRDKPIEERRRNEGTTLPLYETRRSAKTTTRKPVSIDLSVGGWVKREKDGKINNRVSCVARTKELSSNSNHPHCNYFEAASSAFHLLFMEIE